MARNFIQLGSTLTAVAPDGGVTSGSGVLVNNLFGVAATSASAGAEFELDTHGVFELPKVSADSLELGERVYWDATAKKITAAGAGNYPVGVAARATAAGTAWIRVRLDGVSTAPAA